MLWGISTTFIRNNLRNVLGPTFYESVLVMHFMLQGCIIIEGNKTFKQRKGTEEGSVVVSLLVTFKLTTNATKGPRLLAQKKNNWVYI